MARAVTAFTAQFLLAFAKQCRDTFYERLIGKVSEYEYGGTASYYYIAAVEQLSDSVAGERISSRMDESLSSTITLCVPSTSI